MMSVFEYTEDVGLDIKHSLNITFLLTSAVNKECAKKAISMTELNGLRNIIYLRKSEVYVSKNQFVKSLKNWQGSMTYTVCHATISVTS